MIVLFVISQSIIITDGSDTFGVQIKVPSMEGEIQTSGSVETRNEMKVSSSEVSYKLTKKRVYGSVKVVVEILQPEGGFVEITDERGNLLHSADIPTRFEKVALKDGYYRFTVKKDGKVWTKKLKLERKYEYKLYVNFPTASASVEVEETAPAKPQPMSETSFMGLLNSMRAESFEDTRLDILRSAAKKNYFTTSQLSRILDLFKFEDNRVSAFKIVYPRLVDKENVHSVLNKFKFSSTKEEILDWIDSGGKEAEWEEGW